MIVYAAPEEIEKPSIGAFFGLGKSDMAGYQRAEQAYIEAVSTHAIEAGEKHALAGQYVSVPYADGSAQYIVIKANGKVGLIHLDIMDGWRDGRFERTATVAELRLIVETRRKRAEFDAARERERKEAAQKQ